MCPLKDLNKKLLFPCPIDMVCAIQWNGSGLTIAAHPAQGADPINPPPKTARISHHPGHLQPPQSLEEGVPVGQRGVGCKPGFSLLVVTVIDEL